MKKNISKADRNNTCRIAACTFYASHVLAKHGFQCDESYRNSGLAVRHICPAKNWAVIVRASYDFVQVENDTPGGIKGGTPEFVEELLKDCLFSYTGNGVIGADFDAPLEEVWACIEPHMSKAEIAEIFSITKDGAD